jgi:hypothetical protein
VIAAEEQKGLEVVPEEVGDEVAQVTVTSSMNGGLTGG